MADTNLANVNQGIKLKRPIITYLIIFINVFILIIMELVEPSLSEDIFIKFGAQFNPFVIIYGDYWRLFTANFLHGGSIHLFFNCLALYFLGTYFEAVWGRIKFLFVYLVSCIASGVATLIFIDGISVGASGAVFGIVGAIFATALTVKDASLIFLKPNAKRVLFIFIIINLLIGPLISLINWIFKGVAPEINTPAHLGGLIAGLFIGYFFVSSKKGGIYKIKGILVLTSLFICIIIAPLPNIIYADIKSLVEDLQKYYIRNSQQYATFGDLEKGREILKKAISLNKGSYKNESLECLYITLTRSMGKEDEAIEIAKKYLEEYPYSECILSELLYIYISPPYSNLNIAKFYVDQLKMIYFPRKLTQIRIGMYYLKKGEIQLGKEILEELVARELDVDPSIYYSILEADFYLGNYNEVIAKAEELESKVRSPLLLWELKERSYYALGDYEKADTLRKKIKETYDKEISSSPNEAGLFNNYAWYLADKEIKPFHYALKLAEKAIELDPNSHYFYDTLGWVYLKSKKYDKAIEAIEKALSISNETVYYYHLGVIYYHLGELDKSISYLIYSLTHGLEPYDRKNAIDLILKIDPWYSNIFKY